MLIQSIVLNKIRGLDDWTALHFASNEGNVEIVTLLLQHGASVDVITKF